MTSKGVTLMGRGRQRAKQTKVARKLKYFSPETDYQALERELAGGQSEDNDPYADLYEQYADDEDDEDEDYSDLIPSATGDDEDSWR